MNRGRKRLIISAGVVSLFVATGVGLLLAERIPYWRRERDLIDVLKPDTSQDTKDASEEAKALGVFDRLEHLKLIPEKLLAIQELGRMRSARAVPYILHVWDELEGHPERDRGRV